MGRRKKQVDTATPAILERNLERYPWSRLSDDKGDQIVEASVQFAENSPEPELSELYNNIYVSEQC